LERKGRDPDMDTRTIRGMLGVVAAAAALLSIAPRETFAQG
jgi:hypothetical protein